VHQENDWAISLSDQVAIWEASDAQFGRAFSMVAPENLSVYGTDAVIRWRGDESLRVEVDATQVWFFMRNTVLRRAMRGERLLLSDSTLEGKIVKYVPLDSDANRWREVHVSLSLVAQNHQLRVNGVHIGPGDQAAVSPPLTPLGGDYFTASFMFDSITVLDRTVENVFPLAAGAAIALGMTLWVVANALRARCRRKLEASG
jgi:hypothetical protein